MISVWLGRRMGAASALRRTTAADFDNPPKISPYQLEMALDDYLDSEIVLDCGDGLFSRREAMRRLMLLGLRPI